MIAVLLIIVGIVATWAGYAYANEVVAVMGLISFVVGLVWGLLLLAQTSRR
jgi:hydrogenase/urease accessory protein HupE